MTSPSIVRRAGPDDRLELWRLITLWHKEQFTFTLSERKIDYHLTRFLQPETIKSDDFGPRGLIGVIGSPSELEGMIIIGLSSFWYTDESNADEYVSFVVLEHRSSTHYKSLISYAKYITDTTREVYPDFRLIMGILSVKRTAAKVRLLGQQLQPVGCYFTWPPIDGIQSEPMNRLYKGH